MIDRYHMSVCPHDTAKNIAGWFLINTYIQRRLNHAIRFEPEDNFNQEREKVLAGGFQIVYANPFSAMRYGQQLGFLPVAKPVGSFDETHIVARTGEGVPTKRPVKIASATDKLIVHFLGMTMLEQVGLTLKDVEFQFVGNHLKAAQAVINGQCDLGFVFNETWNGLGVTSKQALHSIAETKNQQAFHCFCIAPELEHQYDLIQGILCGMSTDPAGQKVLEDLRFKGFEPLPRDTLAKFGSLVGAS